MIDDIQLELASLYFGTADALRAGQLCVADSTNVMLRYLKIRAAEEELDGDYYRIVRGWNRYHDDDEIARAARLDEVGRALVQYNRNELLRKENDMPLCLTDKTFDVCLRGDEQKPEGVRPVFMFRFLSYTDASRVRKLRTQAEESLGNPACTDADAQAAFELYQSALKIALVGWRNMGAVEYSPDTDLGTILSDNETVELAWRFTTLQQRAEHALRDAGSQPKADISTDNQEKTE